MKTCPEHSNRYCLSWMVLVLLFLPGLVATVLMTGCSDQTGSGDPTSGPRAKEGTKQDQTYTCPMHPDVRLPEPGECPKCGMELVPFKQDSGEEHPRRLSMSPTAKKLAEVRTRPAERRFVDAEVRLVGEVTYDETRMRTVTAWVPGRLERMFVDYTGLDVRMGDHMVSIYSPKILVTQQDLLDAKRSLERAKTDKERQSARRSLSSVRERLRKWGLTKEQIRSIEERDEPTDQITLNAPTGGVVIKKHRHEGNYVDTGSPIYTIADLSEVWIEMEAYEKDMPWIRYGQPITLETDAVPGRKFEGRISFIEPTLDTKTRTIGIRVEVKNPNQVLKPGMFVHGVVHASVAGDGNVMDPELSGKYICRMHPGEIQEDPGACSICGMDLESVESLGYEAPDTKPPIVIPASAPLITGKRAVVYVEVPDTKKPTYEGREVVLGPRAGDYYIVESGLKPNEEVVVNGNFQIDSELQIRAKPSMMYGEKEERPSKSHDHDH